MPVTEAEEEVEIDSADCDILPLEGDRADLGEAAVQTLSLALDPFPRHPDADRILVEKGVPREEQAGPFSARAQLRGQSGRSAGTTFSSGGLRSNGITLPRSP